MAKLRHIAMTVDDVAQTQRFYEEVFGMTALAVKSHSTILTDGVMTLAIVDKNMPAFGGHNIVGLHHIGFLVDDVETTRETIEARRRPDGDGTSVAPTGQSVRDWVADDRARAQTSMRVATEESRTSDLNGIGVELVSADYARRTWTNDGRPL